MNIRGSDVKRVLGVVVTAVSAVSAFMGVFAEKQQAKEFEEMKKAIADLQKEKK